MRWAIVPALAAVAGCAGGALGDWLSKYEGGLWPMAGGIAGAAAVASTLTRRAWPCFLAAPALGILGAAAGPEVLRRGSAWETLSWVLGAPDALILLSAAGLFQVLIHWIGARRSRWAALAAGLVSSGALFLAALPLVAASIRFAVGAFLALSTLAQVPVALAARAIARRLRPPEAA